MRDHDFCLIPPYYTDTDPTSREWAVRARIKPMTFCLFPSHNTDTDPMGDQSGDQTYDLLSHTVT